MTRRPTLRSLMTAGKPLVTPVAHDALSARLIELAGFRSIAIGGSSMLAARFALPDLGIAALAEMVAGARDILAATTLPCSIDGDDGYGDVKGVVRTVRAYEAIYFPAEKIHFERDDPKTVARMVIPNDPRLA